MAKRALLTAGSWFVTAVLGAVVGGLVVHYASTPAAPAASVAVRAPPEDPAQFRAREVRDQAALLARARAEPRDEPWAKEVAGQIRTNLERAKQQNPFEVVDVDCRTTICTAAISWPDYALAQKASPAMVAPFDDPPCSRSMYTLPPEDAAARYENFLVFDCKGARARP